MVSYLYPYQPMKGFINFSHFYKNEKNAGCRVAVTTRAHSFSPEQAKICTFTHKNEIDRLAFLKTCTLSPKKPLLIFQKLFFVTFLINYFLRSGPKLPTKHLSLMRFQPGLNSTHPTEIPTKNNST
jgi:hypothetical protein